MNYLEESSSQPVAICPHWFCNPQSFCSQCSSICPYMYSKQGESLVFLHLFQQLSLSNVYDLWSNFGCLMFPLQLSILILGHRYWYSCLTPGSAPRIHSWRTSEIIWNACASQKPNPLCSLHPLSLPFNQIIPLLKGFLWYRHDTYQASSRRD